MVPLFAPCLIGIEIGISPFKIVGSTTNRSYQTSEKKFENTDPTQSVLTISISLYLVVTGGAEDWLHYMIEFRTPLTRA